MEKRSLVILEVQLKGNRIDVLMGSKSKAMNWGRQTVKVKIL